MPAQPLVIPLPKMVAYSDQYLGQVAASYKLLLNLHLPIPETIVIPPDTLERMYTASPMRTKILELLKNYNEGASDKHKQQSAVALKLHLSRLHLDSEIIHLLNHWYHDYLGHGEVKIVASNYPQFTHDQVSGNVNVIESILEVWSASTHECLATQSHAHSCLAPTPIVLIKQPKVTFCGVLFVHHPEQLTKASVVCYLWPEQVPDDPTSPYELLELDIRSNTIVRRTTSPEAKNKPIQMNQSQLSNLFLAAAKLKRQGGVAESATFIFHQNQILFTELPSHYLLPPQPSRVPRTATQVLVAASSTTMLKRAGTIGDGVGIISAPIQLETSVIQSQPALFRTTIQGVEYLLQNQAVLDQHMNSMQSITKKSNNTLGLLPTSIHSPTQWSSLLRILKTKYRVPSLSIPLWFEISTPAVVTGLRYFDLTQISGVVIQVDALLKYALGNETLDDTNGDFSSLTNAVMSQTLEQVLQVLKSLSDTRVIPIWIQTSLIETDLISIAVSTGCQAVVCPINQVTVAREAISQSEKILWQRRQRT